MTTFSSSLGISISNSLLVVWLESCFLGLRIGLKRKVSRFLVLDTGFLLVTTFLIFDFFVHVSQFWRFCSEPANVTGPENSESVHLGN